MARPLRIEYPGAVYHVTQEHLRVTHLKGTVKRKKLSCGEKRERFSPSLVVIFILTIATVLFGFGVSLHCTSHPSGLRSLMKLFIHDPFRLLADQKSFQLLRARSTFLPFTGGRRRKSNDLLKSSCIIVAYMLHCFPWVPFLTRYPII
jgi:hypothetical protein